jgi:hypothetical protein
VDVIECPTSKTQKKPREPGKGSRGQGADLGEGYPLRDPLGEREICDGPCIRREQYDRRVQREFAKFQFRDALCSENLTEVSADPPSRVLLTRVGLRNPAASQQNVASCFTANRQARPCEFVMRATPTTHCLNR